MIIGFSSLVALSNGLVDVVQSLDQRIHGGALQVGIHGGLHPQAAVVQGVLGEILQKTVTDIVHEIRRIAGIDLEGSKLELCSLCLFSFLSGDEFQLDHFVQHHVPPLCGAVGVPDGRVGSAWRGNNRSKSGGFGQCQRREVLSKISDGSFSKSFNAERSPSAEINVVGVKREDLLLRQTLFEQQRHKNVVYLPGQLEQERGF